MVRVMLCEHWISSALWALNLQGASWALFYFKGLGFGVDDVCVTLWALDLQGALWALQIWYSV